MIKLTVKDVLENCDAKLLIGDESKEINECFVDSKKVTLGSTFFGIKGENTDGSLFYKEAFFGGADICIINKIYDLDLNGFDDKTVIVANDTLKVLHELAAYKRTLFNGKVIMITGSVGKTSTKEMLYDMLKNKYKVLKTMGNQNSQIGLPLNILRLKDEEILLLEAGMNDVGHIHNLSLIAKPDIGIITNVLTSHIGMLGSKENILKAKLEILDGMDSESKLIINNDNDMLSSWYDSLSDKSNIIKFGIENSSDVIIYDINENINTSFSVNNIKDISIKGPKEFIYNFMPAYIVSKMLDIKDDDIIVALENISDIKHRLEVIKIGNITIIDDSYNASLESTFAALKYLGTFKIRKIAVIGDLLELGKSSKKMHQEIGNYILQNNIDIVITIGKYSNHINKTLRKKGFKKKHMKHFKTEKLSRKYIDKIIKDEDVILIKGSNGMNLINLVKYLKIKKDLF